MRQDETPLVSIICPCYNHAPYLSQALESILMQEVDFPYEVLVGEDCSPDHSREILKEYEAKYPDVFHMFYREKNMGGTRNAYDLYTRARGRYLIVLETDDYWTDPHKLRTQVDFLNAHPEYIGCAHACQVVDASGTPQSVHPADIPPEGRVITLRDFLEQGFLFQSATLLYRNIYRDGGDYSIICKAHPLVGDLTTLSLLFHRGNVFLSPACMSAYRRVIKPGGTSAASQSHAYPAQSLQATMQQLVMLEEYFQGQIDYSPQKVFPVQRYLTGYLRREQGFTGQGMRYMWKHAGSAVRRQTVGFLLGYPARLIRKAGKKP